MPNDPKELGTFRIADVRRPAVRSFTKAQAAVEETEARESLGFPAIESRLESMTLEQLADELRPTYEALERLATQGDFRTKGPAAKAMAAYERTADLFEYLYEVRENMAAARGATE